MSLIETINGTINTQACRELIWQANSESMLPILGIIIVGIFLYILLFAWFVYFSKADLYRKYLSQTKQLDKFEAWKRAR